MDSRFSFRVIPGHAEGVSPESITTNGAIMDRSVVMDSGHALRAFRNDKGGAYASLQCLHTPEISITGLFGVKPALLAAAFKLSATAPEAASPTAPQCSQMRNTTGAPET